MRRLLCTLGLLASGAAGCAPAEPQLDAVAAGPGRYPIVGTVVARPGPDTVTLAHDAVVNVMPSMVMDFRGDNLAALATGDRVRATLVVTRDSTRLTDVQVVAAASGTSYVSTPGVAAPLGTVVPDAELRNQDDAVRRLSQYRGQVLLVTFIYTRCPLPDFCPRLMRNFIELHRALAAKPEVASRVQLLSATIDPEFDTPDVLRAYGRALIGGPAPFERWDLVTGAPDEIRRLADFVGLLYEPESGVIRHSMDVAIIGADGRLVRRFPSMTWDLQQAISVVSRETARATPIDRNN